MEESCTEGPLAKPGPQTPVRERGLCLIPSGNPTAGSLLPTTHLQCYCRLGQGTSPEGGRGSHEEVGAAPRLPFAPSHMVADAELLSPIALDQVEQGPDKREV